MRCCFKTEPMLGVFDPSLTYTQRQGSSGAAAVEAGEQRMRRYHTAKQQSLQEHLETRVFTGEEQVVQMNDIIVKKHALSVHERPSSCSR